MATRPMSIDELPANSYKARRESAPGEKPGEQTSSKTIKPIVKSKTSVVKESKAKSIFSDAWESLLDSLPDIIEYAVQDVIVPSLKNMFFDAITGGLGRAMYGSIDYPRRYNYGSATYHTNYNRVTSRPVEREAQKSNTGGYTNPINTIIEYDTYDDAECVRQEALHIIDLYSTVTVADIYDLSNKTHNYTQQKWGWNRRTFASAKVVPYRRKWIIRCQKPKPIDMLLDEDEYDRDRYDNALWSSLDHD